MRRLFVVAAVLIPTLAAAEQVWVSTGPTGAIVLAIATDPAVDGVVYAGVQDGGVFRTAPGSPTTWKASNSGLTDLNVRALAVASGGVVLAGTNTGIFRSANGAGSWTRSSGPPVDSVDAIAFDPHAPSTAYAVGLGGWVGKSTDGGQTWQALGGDPSENRPRAVTVDPTNGSTVYVGTIDNGVYKSTNGGATWTAMNTGLTNLHAATIAVDPTSASVVYLGTENGGAFRSEDGGANWTVLTNGLQGSDVDAIVVGPDGTTFAINRAGAYQLLDPVLGWTVISGFQYGNALALGPGTPGTLWLGFGQLPFTDGGVAVKRPGAAVVPAPGDGLNGVWVTAFGIDPENPSTVLTSGASPGKLSPDGGVSWFSPFAPALGLTLVFDPQAPGAVYEGRSNGVAKSTDGGTGWANSNNGLPNAAVRALLLLPGGAGRLLAGTSAGVYRSADGGANWTAAATATPGIVYSFSKNPASSTVFAGAADGVYRSSDEGVNWTLAATTTSPVHAILDSSVAPSKIFAGTDGGALVSTNGGSSFAPVGGGLPVGRVFALLEEPPRSAIYVAGDAGVFQSVDGGATWSPAATGLTNPQVLCLALSSGTLLAGTQGGSVFRRVETSAERDPVERSDGRGGTREVPPRSE